MLSQAGRRAFTLIELLIVVLIIGLITAVALPAVLPALSKRQVSEAARLVQSAVSGARDQAIANSSPAGFRLVPDPAFPLSYLPSGQIDLTKPLAFNRLVPLSSGNTYSDGLVGSLGFMPTEVMTLAYPGPGNQNISNPVYGNTGAAVVFEVFESVDSTGKITLNAPTSWWWNVRLGDKIQINGSGIWYTVIGPMAIGPTQGNSELYTNIGQPNTRSPLSQSLPSGGTGYAEFLILSDGVDNNLDGYIDNGWDGFDNDYQNGIDDIGEWVETEKQVPACFSVPYVVQRRPFPVQNQKSIDLPTNVVIDASKSVISINPYSGYADILVNPNGTLFQPLIYSSLTSVGMNSSFVHLWLAERADINVNSPQGSWALTTIFARTGRVNSLFDPDPKTAISIAQQGSK
jgi:prepilin-type N-terminal cleavage/methylation domain-containing protein